jgi:anti-sigma factor (TIGR02949 family)
MPPRPDDCAAVLPLLEVYLDGELSPSEAEGVREHVARCSDCAADLDLARAIQDGLRALPELDAPPAVLDRVRAAARLEPPNVVPFPRPATPRRFAALAAMLALAVLSALLLFKLRSPAPQPAPAATARAATPEEVARATAEARVALAYVGQVSRRAGLALKDEVLPERLLAPAARVLSRSFQEIPGDGSIPSAPRQGS